jgi:Na+/H+ antiporter NhaD/arsenite permease-like protein
VSLAAVSLLALLAVIVVSCFAPVNIGFLSIALAFLIGRAGGLPVSAIVGGFPASLFVTLTGVTLLFSQSRVNGTLEQVAARSVRLARGNRGMIPIVFFVLGVALASIGAGNIAATALLAPVAMSVAGRAGISGFLMALMLANGANAGAFSPLAPTGIIARDLMGRAGLEGVEWANYFNTLAAQSVVAFGGYFLLGGLKLFRARADPASEAGPETEARAEPLATPLEPITGRQWLTLGVITALILSVVFHRIDVGLGAFVAAAILTLLRAADEEAAMRCMPWGVILMVSGVTILVEVLAKTGGMELFTRLLAGLSGPAFVTGVIALVTGVISVYSSSSGVVLPAFLPTIPGLIDKLGGGDPLMIAYSINVGAHLVDVSPLSTLGALCLASAAPSEDRDKLFRKLMAWGWSMALVGGLVCQLLFGYRR